MWRNFDFFSFIITFVCCTKCLSHSTIWRFTTWTITFESIQKQRPKRHFVFSNFSFLLVIFFPEILSRAFLATSFVETAPFYKWLSRFNQVCHFSQLRLVTLINQRFSLEWHQAKEKLDSLLGHLFKQVKVFTYYKPAICISVLEY